MNAHLLLQRGARAPIAGVEDIELAQLVAKLASLDRETRATLEHLSRRVRATFGLEVANGQVLVCDLVAKADRAARNPSMKALIDVAREVMGPLPSAEKTGHGEPAFARSVGSDQAMGDGLGAGQ